MSDTSIFEISDMDVDMSNYVKIRTRACLNDSLIFKCYIYSSSTPVNLDNYNIEFRARLAKTGNIYSETDNITKNGNLLTINCDSILCSEIGECNITIRLWDKTYKQKSNYLIVLKVMDTISEDEKLATSSVLSSLNSLDYSIARYLELKVDLQGEITLAETALSNLTTEVNLANTTLTNMVAENSLLINSYNNAITMNDKLDNNVNRATNLDAQVETHINNLNSSITIAKYQNNLLTTTETSAEALNTELESENSWASEQITIMKSFGDIKTLAQLMSNYEIELNSLAHFVDIMMQNNPIPWTDDNGISILDDSGNVVII